MAGVGAGRAGRPVVLFGAFDRHNFGDLLFPHLAAAMLLPPGEAAHVIPYLEARPAVRRAWVRRTIGAGSAVPFLAPRALLPPGSRVLYHAVGGVDLPHCAAALRSQAAARLAEADLVTVRDSRTLAWAQAAGVDARLAPDGALLAARLFGPRIRRHALRGELARLREAVPGGYLSVQFAAEAGDDASLDALAAVLRRVASATGLGIALFRAGMAPWHDELSALHRLALRLAGLRVRVFEGAGLWDICALIASSRGYFGSSLHGRILAMAFALPRVGLEPGSARRPGKHASFARTWEPAPLDRVADIDAAGDALLAALGEAPALRSRTARRLAAECARGYAALSAAA
ncbi:polysaccharide pyruvyl transferase family protein [Quisquiliibacterium transsilvanicum]|uniref:Polysaccharide pyruvyl transferase domain-containing protein n=1 Tax=Quisquiliibacterium transsilvanicum TaxID=1549638 RepID=A0A7W8MA07_9BURK|nr:polysaccharide pyruvyl transferase family protein [Quisquiliibacterium transsilvanicum]MBB5273551.1 hypothetical protein [Quisquiliibacterium transsilvanicum]